MGGSARPPTRACAVEIVNEWERHENFFLYDDALPAIAELRRHNLSRWVSSLTGSETSTAFAEHHQLDVDVCVGSKHHGYVKPHRSIFEAALDALDVTAADAAMVGDSPEDDIEGARALGMRAILLDREGVHPDWEGAIHSLAELPAVLGLEPAPT